MFWAARKSYWLTDAAVISLATDNNCYTLDGEWHWFAATPGKLPRGRYYLAPEAMQLKLVTLPQGLALQDVSAFAASLFPADSPCRVAWQPIGDNQLLAMATAEAVLARLPFATRLQPWLLTRFNRACTALSGEQWSWVTVYPGGAWLCAGKDQQLTMIKTLAHTDWLSELSALPRVGQGWVDDPFALLPPTALSDWERGV